MFAEFIALSWLFRLFRMQVQLSELFRSVCDGGLPGSQSTEPGTYGPDFALRGPQGALRHERACAPGFASRENFAQVARGS